MATKPQDIVPTSGTDIRGNLDSQTPVGAQSLSGNRGGLSQEQASGIQQIYKNKLASGMTPAQAQEAIKADPSFSKAQAQFNQPVQATPSFSASVTPIGQQKTEGTAPVVPVSAPTTSVPSIGATTTSPTTPSVTTPPPNVEKTTTTTPEGKTTVQKETPGISSEEMKRIADVSKQNRQNEVLMSLNEGYKNDKYINKAITTGDYETYKTAFNYETADPVKKETLDAFFQARQPKNSESFFATLAQGMKIENSKYRESGEARDAQHRYDVVSPYKGASVDTLYNGMNNGIITPGSKAYKDLVTANGGIETPEMVLAKQKLETKRSIDKVNEGLRAQSSANKGELPIEKPDATQTISDKIVNTKGQSWADKFKEMVQGDSETKDLSEKIKTDSLRKKEIERIRADIFKNIVKNNPGMTMGAANLKAKYESEGFDEEYNNLIDTLNVNSADLRYKTSLLEKAFDFDYKEAQQQEERAYQAQQTETQFGRQKELARFQQDLQLSGNQAEFEQKIAQQAALASDPYTAISTVMDEYKKLGIPFTQSLATKVNDANAFIKAGGTIGGYVDKMIKDIQAKPEYKTAMSQKLGGITPYEQAQLNMQQKKLSFDMAKESKKSWTKLDDGMYQDQDGNVVTADEMKQNKTIQKIASIEPGTYTGQECGTWARTQLGMTATPGGNSLDDRKKAFNSQDAKEGGLVLFSGGGYDKQYGHIAIVTGVNADGTINVKESNYNDDKKVTERNNVPTTYVQGYYNNTPLASGTTGITQGGQDMADKFLVFEEASKLPSVKQKTEYLEAAGYKMQDYININEEIRNKERANKDISSTYRSMLSLGGGVSESDKQDIMRSYYDALYSGDKEGMVKAAKGALVKNKELGPAITSFNETVNSLGRITNGLKKYVEAGGSTDIFEGSLESVSQKLGATTDTNLSEIKAGMDILLAQYIKAQSGTAASDTERKFLSGVMPSINNLSGLNIAKIKALGKASKDSLMASLQTQLYGREDFLNKYIEPDFKIAFTPYKVGKTEGITVGRAKTAEVPKYNSQFDSVWGD